MASEMPTRVALPKSKSDMTVVGKYRFWRISPYTWLNLCNYIQINHIRGWDSVIIRVPTICMVGHNLKFTEIYEMNHTVVRFSGAFQ